MRLLTVGISLLLVLLFCFSACSNRGEETKTTDGESTEITSSEEKDFTVTESSGEDETTEYQGSDFLAYKDRLFVGQVAVSYFPELTEEEVLRIYELMPVEYSEEDAKKSLDEKTSDYIIETRTETRVRWEFYKEDGFCYVKNPDGNFGKADISLVDTVEEIYYGKIQLTPESATAEN